ncbi:hypothetical protein MTO96_037313 [Rhipicephalus appendiculatus]
MCVRCTLTHVWPQGIPPRPLPRTGLSRHARAFLLRLRTDCSRTAERLFRLSGNGSPSCAQCPAEETLEHILLQCPGYDDQRHQLLGVYGRLGLPHVLLLATLCSPAAAGPVTWDGSPVDGSAGLHACVDEADRTCGLF